MSTLKISLVALIKDDGSALLALVIYSIFILTLMGTKITTMVMWTDFVFLWWCLVDVMKILKVTSENLRSQYLKAAGSGQTMWDCRVTFKSWKVCLVVVPWRDILECVHSRCDSRLLLPIMWKRNVSILPAINPCVTINKQIVMFSGFFLNFY